MNRPRLAFAFAFGIASLGACRAVLGIDTLEVVDGGRDGALSDVGVADAGGDDGASPADTGAHDAAPDVVPACTGQGGACFQCCRQALSNNYFPLQVHAAQTGCICASDGGACTSECTIDGQAPFCGPSGDRNQPPPMGGNCGQCLDPAMRSGSPECVAAQNACIADPQCKPAWDCLSHCTP